MYSTPALQVARRFGAPDITESRLLQYDVICAVCRPALNAIVTIERDRRSLYYGKL
jgi:hypothetical protein